MENGRGCLRVDQDMMPVDCDSMNVYAHVVSHDSNRMLIVLEVAEGSFREGKEVHKAYSYGNLDKHLIIEHPPDSSNTHKMPGHDAKIQKFCTA